jgi:hypothetical protein
MESLSQAKDNSLNFDLGTFEGFNFRTQSAIENSLSAEEVIAWDHDHAGEAEFWPSGDNAGVRLVFQGQSSVTASEISALDALLSGLGDDSPETFLRVYYTVQVSGASIREVQVSQIEDQDIHLFIGDSFIEIRQKAAYELFELYYPEAYAIWEKTYCDGLIFDTDRFLDSPGWSVEELSYGDNKVLIVSPQ